MLGVRMLDKAAVDPNWLLSLLTNAPDPYLARTAETSWQRSGSIVRSAQDAFPTVCLIIQTSQMPRGKVHAEQNTWEMCGRKTPNRQRRSHGFQRSSHRKSAMQTALHIPSMQKHQWKRCASSHVAHLLLGAS